MKQHNSLSQFILITCFAFSISLNAQVIADGNYAIFSSVNNQAVTAPNQPDFDAFMTDPDDTDAGQVWSFIHQGDDIYQMQNTLTGNFMGINDNWCGQFGDVQARFSSTDTNINFKLSPGNLAGSFIIEIAFTDCGFDSTNDPIRAFDIPSGDEGAELQTFDNDPTNANQQFFIINSSKLGASGQVIPDGDYAIFSEVHDEVIVAPTPDDFEAFMAPVDPNNANQIWTFTHVGNDEYQILNTATGNYLGVNDGWCGQFGDVRGAYAATDQNIDIKLNAATAADSYLMEVAFTQCNFDSVNDPIKAFDIENGASGGQVQTFDRAFDNPNQQFRFVTAADLLNTPDVTASAFTIQIFPVPAKEYITLEMSELSNKVSARLYNITGQQLIKKNLVKAYSTLDISTLDNGVYFVSVFENHQLLLTKRIIVSN